MPHIFYLTFQSFDVQDLTIIMDLSFDLKEEALWVPWSESFSLDNPKEQGSSTKNFIQFNRAFSAIPDFEAQRVIVEFAVREDCWGQVKIRIQMARLPEGTLGRIASLCALLGISTLCTFSMDPVNNHTDRVNFLITLILAFVAFQFIVSSSLPDAPYLTILDKYTLSSFTYIVTLQGVLCIIERASSDVPYRIYIDNILFFVCLGVVLLIQGGFILRGFLARHKEFKKLQLGMRQLDEVNDDKSSTPINVYGSDLLQDCTTKTTGDPFVTFARVKN